jgi:hypothetical protein
MFLLFVGFMFLLNSTGVINWNVWAVLWRFWPVFLILSGARLLLGNSKIANWIIGSLALLCFSFIIFSAYVSYSVTDLDFLPMGLRNRIGNYNSNIFESAGDVVEEEYTIARDDYEDIQNRTLLLRIGAKEFSIGDKEDNSYFYSNSQYFENYGEPTITEEKSDGTLLISFIPEMKNFSSVSSVSYPKYDFQLGNREIPTSFDMELGAGEGKLDLQNLLVEDIEASVGAGAMTFSFSKESLPSGTMTLDVGAGEMVIKLPEDVGFELDYDLGIGEISTNGKSIATFAGSRDGYQSSNYDNAEKTVKIVVSVGVGSLSIDN